MKDVTPVQTPETPSEGGAKGEGSQGGGAAALCDLCKQLEQGNAHLEECNSAKGDCKKKLEQCLKDKESLESNQGIGSGSVSGSGLPKCEN